MSVYKRGGIWWYKFQICGIQVRESAHTSNKELAVKIQRQRRAEIESSAGGIEKSAGPVTFQAAAKEWFSVRSAHWSEANKKLETFNLKSLHEHFGRMLLADIRPRDIADFQRKRIADGVSPRTINMSLGTLRAILRHYRLWERIAPDVRMLRVRTDVGRALNAEEANRVLEAAKGSRSRSLYPAIALSLHTGLRNGELRNLRWRDVNLERDEIRVPTSKTTSGENRIVPLSAGAREVLLAWRENFPNWRPEHFIFCSEMYGETPEGSEQASVYAYEPHKPRTPWKTSWETCRRDAKVACRWHDFRHTFVSRLAEAGAPDATIMSICGHVSLSMLRRYSHTSGSARRQAISKAFSDSMLDGSY